MLTRSGWVRFVTSKHTGKPFLYCVRRRKQWDSVWIDPWEVIVLSNGCTQVLRPGNALHDHAKNYYIKVVEGYNPGCNACGWESGPMSLMDPEERERLYGGP